MIEKIIEISRLGHFVNYKFQGGNNWNGQFKKVNIIYAPNGSGKTTLSTILKSISSNDLNLIGFKKTFGSTDYPVVKLKEAGSNSIVELSSTGWSSNNLVLEVFDVNYIEEYLFSGSFVRSQNKNNLFKLMLGERGMQFRAKIKPMIHKINRIQEAISQGRYNSNELGLELVQLRVSLKQEYEKYDLYSKEIFGKYVSVMNKYLRKFTHYISLFEFSYQKNSNEFEKFRIFPIFKVYEEKVVFAAPDMQNRIANARYSMSEGDKSTIALCFFLTRLEIQGISDKIIVFDDPLSSFDYSRRNATIFQLAKLANQSIQFILLTHDLNFANDFADKCSFISPLTLKIENDGSTSMLAYYDIKAEFLTSTQKDIEVIKAYLNHGAKNEYDRREVVRCIRPVLEGIFKTKYFDIIPNNKWLGDIIELIRAALPNSKLYRLNSVVEDIIELNDYTKNYHHSTGDSRVDLINSDELRRYVNNLMDVIDKI